jgi:hypothetical protein
MKLRRRYDELTAELSALLQQRELLLTQISDDKAEWEKLQRVSSYRSVWQGASQHAEVPCDRSSQHWQQLCQALQLSTSVLLLGQIGTPLMLTATALLLSLTLQMESEALSQREAALAASHASQQAELDTLLAKQEERLKVWQEGCQELEAQLDARRKELGQEEDRCAAARWFWWRKGF